MPVLHVLCCQPSHVSHRRASCFDLTSLKQDMQGYDTDLRRWSCVVFILVVFLIDNESFLRMKCCLSLIHKEWSGKISCLYMYLYKYWINIL